ncbi:hypothetical protein AWC26_18610 [Mycobacterium shimoidei]|nr:hypothetical protein BHQ16_21885 [Mycobacterium shimoidei]ORW77948.1 hypothetical protein AWC26_18610 [Mycobacterium shimoidei]
MGQLASMPMQMASQAGQVPMQMGAAMPQGVMQAAQAGMQPVSQMSQIAKAAGASAGSGQDRLGEQQSAGGVVPDPNAAPEAAAGQPNVDTFCDGAASGPSASSVRAPAPVRSQT